MAETYDNFYIDISFYFVEKHFDKFKKTIEDPKNQRLRDKIIFGTDWWLIEKDGVHYDQFCKNNKRMLDIINPELWERFSFINPMRFYRIKENADTIANALRKYAEKIKDPTKKKLALGKIDPGRKIIDKLKP